MGRIRPDKGFLGRAGVDAQLSGPAADKVLSLIHHCGEIKLRLA